MESSVWPHAPEGGSLERRCHMCSLGSSLFLLFVLLPERKRGVQAGGNFRWRDEEGQKRQGAEGCGRSEERSWPGESTGNCQQARSQLEWDNFVKSPRRREKEDVWRLGGLSWCGQGWDKALLWSHESVYFPISMIAAYAALSHSHVLLRHCLSPDPAYVPMFAFTFSKLRPAVLATSHKQTLTVHQLPLWASHV